MIRLPPRSTLMAYTTLFRSVLFGDKLTESRCGTSKTRSEAASVRNGLLFAIRPRQDRRPQLKRSEEYTSELQSRQYIVCRLLLEKKNQPLGVTPTTETAQLL